MRRRFAAFVPITLAMAGMAAILLGRVTVHEIGGPDFAEGVDPVITGSIRPSPGSNANDDLLQR